MPSLNKSVVVDEFGCAGDTNKELAGGDKSSAVRGKSASTKTFDELAKAKGIKTFRKGS